MTWTLLPAREFPAHRDEWNELNALSGGSLLLDFAFVDAARLCFASGNEMLGVFREHGTIKAMSLFAPHSPLVWQTFQPANAPIGFWLAAPDVPLEKLVGQVVRKLPGFSLLFGITQQDPDIFPRPAESGKVGVLDYITTPRLTVAGSFDDFWQSRGKNLRHNIQRQSNRMDRENRTGRFEIATSADAMASCVADYAELETLGWKGRENSAVTHGDRQSEFYVTTLQHYAGLQQASVWRYFIDDKLAASNLCIGRDGVQIILKTAYDESFKGFSPSQLMNYEAFRHLFDDGGTQRIEFYGPVKDWHTKWSDETRKMYHLNFYRFAWLRRLRPHHAKAQES